MPHVRFFQSRGLALERRSPRPVRLITGVTQDWRGKELRSWRVHTRFMHTRNWKKSTDFIGAWTRPVCWSQRASWGAGEAMTHRGDEDTGGKRAREYSSVWTLLVAAILTAKSGDKKYPHCWSASGQQPAEQHHSPTRQKTGFLKYS